MVDKKGASVVGILFIVGLFAVAFGVVPPLQHNIAVQEYKPTTATIISTDIRVEETDDDTNYYPEVSYKYTVDGETYREDNVYPGQFERSKDSRSDAQAVIDQYNSGQEVSIQYSPRDHGDAYLRNDGLPGSWLIGIAYAAAAAIGGGWFIYLGFKRRKQRLLMKDTPTEQVQSLSIGPSEIKGTAVTEDREPLPAPFSAHDCVVAKYEIEEYDDDNDDDGGHWKTIQEEVLHMPFYVDDGTGSVLVRPDDEAIFDLDPDDWTTTYVDSADHGPKPIQEFIHRRNDISFPSNAAGKENDRKYKQNLIKDEESVYVFGTVQPKDDTTVSRGAGNEDRVVVEKTDEDSSLREPMYMISDDSEQSLTNRRRWALWRLPVGTFYLGVALACTLLIFGPKIGVPVPVVF